MATLRPVEASLPESTSFTERTDVIRRCLPWYTTAYVPSPTLRSFVLRGGQSYATDNGHIMVLTIFAAAPC